MTRTLKQGRESRLWCMIVCESLDDGVAMSVAMERAACLVVDEESPAADSSAELRAAFAWLRPGARSCATARVASPDTAKRR